MTEHHRVLILTKHRFLGDLVVATPLLRALRQTLPAVQITLLIGEPGATILQETPWVDQVRTYPPGSAERSLRGTVRLVRSLARQMVDLRRHARPDLVFVVDRSFRAAAGARLSGGKRRVGFATEARGFLLTDPVPYANDRPETQCGLDLLRAVVSEPPDAPFDPAPELRVTEAEVARGREMVGSGRPLIGFQPGAQHDYKTWPAERFGAVAECLAGQGAVPVLIGGPDEVDAAQAMARTLSRQPIDLTGKTSLREAMGVLKNLALFVGNDTGIRHIAAALGTPTVALFGPTPATKWASPGPEHATVIAPDRTMASISVDAVLAAAERLL